MVLHEVTAAPIDTLLAQIPYFAELSGQTLAEIKSSMRRRTFAAGEAILIEGRPCEGFYFVIEGQVRLIRTSTEGRNYVLRVLGPGATFNDIAVFDGGPNPDGAVAVGSTIVGVIPKQNVTALIDRYPEVAKAALKLMSSRQRALGSIAEDLALRDVATRVARLLLGCIGQHDHIVEQAPDACAHITHQEIASMVGSVREVVQRVLKDLERDGAIAIERTRIRIRDKSKLKRQAHLNT